MQFRETLTCPIEDRRFECIVPPLALQGGAIKTDQLMNISVSRIMVEMNISGSRISLKARATMVSLDGMHARMQELYALNSSQTADERPHEEILSLLMTTLNSMGCSSFTRVEVQRAAKTQQALEFDLAGTKAYVLVSRIVSTRDRCYLVYSESKSCATALAGALTFACSEYLASIPPNEAKTRQALEIAGYSDDRTGRIVGRERGRKETGWWTPQQWRAWNNNRWSDPNLSGGNAAAIGPRRPAQAAAPAPAQAAERRAQAAASTPAQAAERRAEAANDAVAQAQATLRAAQAEAQAASDAAAQAAQAQAANDAAAQAAPAQARRDRDRDRDRDRKKRKHDEELTAEEIAERMRYYSELAEKRRRGTE